MKKRKSPSPVAGATKTTSNRSDSNDNYSFSSLAAAKLLQQHCQTIKTLQRTISELVGSDNGDGGTPTPTKQSSSSLAQKLSSSLLALSDLKSLQRQISLQVESHAAISKLRRTEVEECSLLLENLNYERDYLQEEISTMKGWKAEQLEKMAWSELGSAPGDSHNEAEEGGKGDAEMEDAATQVTTAEAAIDAYLLNFPVTSISSDASIGSTQTTSHRDPEAHAHILQKLTSDLTNRSDLVDQLSQSKIELKALQKKRNDLRGFLNQIPKKIRELERAGESLSVFFDAASGGNNVWKEMLVNDDAEDTGKTATATGTKKSLQEQVHAANLLVHRPSSQRMRRFQLAQSNLPSPLYVLFVQLVGYLDAWSSLEKMGGVNYTNSSSTTGSAHGDGDTKSNKRKNALDGFVGAAGMDVEAVPPPGEKVLDGDSSSSRVGNENLWSVVLSLSPLDILPSETSSIFGKTSTFSSRASPGSTIKIVFVYSEEQGVVLALIKDDPRSQGMDDGLLDNLFPGDDGLVNPNVSLSLLVEDDCHEEGDQNRINNSGLVEEGDNPTAQNKTAEDNMRDGKPYYWCQVLSGLNFPPPNASISNSSNADEPIPSTGNDGIVSNQQEKDGPSFQIQTCTKAVMRQLHRRIRARRTLAAILNHLGKQQRNTSQMMSSTLPIHPAMRGEKDHGAASSQSSLAKAKLQSWAEDTHTTEGALSTRKYTAIIKHKSNTLRATVTIDTRNYPIERPPAWFLQNEDGCSAAGTSSWGEDHGSVSSLLQNTNSNPPPLFNPNLQRIASHVNQNLSMFVRSDVESTYDWILMHQLAEIVACYEELMNVGELAFNGSGSNNSSSRSAAGEGCFPGNMGGGRPRKGRDRRLVSFGERSPFYRYRNGI